MVSRRGRKLFIIAVRKMGATAAGEVLGEAETLKWREAMGD
jgi:hypothetical protein